MGETTGSLLKQARHANNLTVRKLREKLLVEHRLSLSEQTIRNWEIDRTAIPVKHLRVMAAALGLNGPDELVPSLDGE